MSKRFIFRPCIICKVKNHRKNRKYCSLKCSREGRTLRPETSPCIWCNKPVPQHRTPRKKYCNATCRYTHRKFKAREEARRYCKRCGTVFHAEPASEQKYCCRGCGNYYKWKSKDALENELFLKEEEIWS